MVGAVVVHDAVAPGRVIDMIDVFKHNDCKEASELLVIFPLILLLFLQNRIIVEIIHEVSLLHQKAIDLKKVLDVSI